MDVVALRTPGLGDTTYLLTHGGRGLVVDPQRDVDRFLAAARDAGVEVSHVLETHLHNDYISGGRELARRTGAEHVLPAGAGVAFPHVRAFHMEDLEGEAGMSIRPIHTPGHTPEHVSYLVLIDGRPRALFSGGSLLVGSAGRTDLLGPERAYELAVSQFGSVRRLAALPGDVCLYPTHGEGSFCTASNAGKTVSTIAAEVEGNPVLRHRDPEAFAREHLAGLVPYPSYYAHMGPLNLIDPRPLPRRPVPELGPDQVEALAGVATVVDARPERDFASGHLPGSLGIPAGDGFASWVGWLLPFDRPVLLVIDDGDPGELAIDLARIGFERVVGFLDGVEGWCASGRELRSFRTVDVDTFAAAVSDPATRVLDVRAPNEWREGHLEGSILRYLPDLARQVPDGLAAGDEVWVGCASGYRSTIAAGLLERAGVRPVVLLGAGIPEVLARLRGRDRLPDPSR